MKINTRILEELNPCKDRWDNYLKHYSSFSGTLEDFLRLDKISADDKWWVLNKKLKELPESLLRHFAFACASRAVDNCDIVEVVDYFNAMILIYESGELELLNSEEYRAAHWAADRAAHWAAHLAAHWAAHLAAHLAADRAAHLAAHWAANRATHLAANRAAEKQKQIDYLIELLEELDK